MSKARDEFIAKFVQNFPERTNEAVDAARLLLRHAKTYDRLQEMACESHPAMNNPNIDIKVAGRLQEEREKWIEKREGQIEKRIAKIVEPFGLRVRFGGDPRGFTVALYFPDNSYNSWGGQENGWGIPTT